MSELAKPETTLKTFFEKEGVKSKFNEMLGNRSTQFITSVLQIATNNPLLSKADPISIYNAAATAATLDLPLNNNLGFAWIVPFSGKAQFQIGWKGFVQLAMRTGQYLRINVVEVYENQFKGWNSLTEELDADFSLEGTGKIVGYCAYFKLQNGFEKVVYWSREKVIAHGKKYSKTFNNGPWKTDENAMCKKTVLKNALSQWGILSVEMQSALRADQGFIKGDNINDAEVEYLDSPTAMVDKELERILLLLEDCATGTDVDMLFESLTEDEQAQHEKLFTDKKKELRK